MVDGNWVFDHRAFTRRSDCDSGTELVPAAGDGGSYSCSSGTLREYDRVENSELREVPSPGVFAAYNFAALGLDELTVAGGLFGPPRSDRVWPADGPQRYGEVESRNLQVHYALGLGYELPWYGIRLGATGMLITQTVQTQLRLNTFFSYPESETHDAHIDADAVDAWIPAAIFGASARPIGPITIAVAAQLPYDVEANGTATVEFQRDIGDAATVTGDEIDVVLHMPWLVRAAVLYRHPDASFDVELAFQWEGWRRYDEVTFRPIDMEVTSDLLPEPIVLEEILLSVNARDTGSLRLGGEYRVIPDMLAVRAGAFYERAAVGGGNLNVGFFDLDKIGLTAGARVELPFRDWLGLPFVNWIDVAGGYLAWRTKEVTTSKIRIINPLATPPAERWPIGNGTYESYSVVIQAAIGGRVDI
jgi:long-chain fatty acid transport protein